MSFLLKKKKKIEKTLYGMETCLDSVIGILEIQTISETEEDFPLQSLT